MKNENKSFGYGILGILFVLLSIISFVVPTVKTGTFWIAYFFSIVAFVRQVPIWNKSLGKKDSLKSKFFGIPIVYVSIVYLILQIVVFVVLATVLTLPVWAATIVCLIIWGVSAVCMISSEIGLGKIERLEEKVHLKVFYIKSLQAEVELLAGLEKNSETKMLLKQLAEKIRFSDPISHAELAEIELAITGLVGELKTASDKKAIINEIHSLLTARNIKTKMLK